MGELDLAGKIEFTYTPAGLIAARDHVEALAKATNQAAAAAPGLNDGLRNTGKASDISRNQIAAMTAVLFRSIGFSSQAGAAARVAGTAFSFMGDAAQMANLKLAGVTLGLSLIIPLLLEVFSKGEEAASSISALGNNAAEELAALIEYRDRTKDVSAALQERIDRLTELAFAQQAVQVQENLERMAKLAKIEDELRDAQAKLVRVVGNSVTINKEAQESINKLLPRWQAAELEIKALAAANEELSGAIKEGVVLDLERRRSLALVTQGLRDEKRITDELAARKKMQNDADRKNKEFVINHRRQEKKDQDDMAARTRQYIMDNIKDEKARQVALAALYAEERAREADQAQFKRDTQRSVVADGLNAMAALFSGNKALAIAAAIADTYVAANRAFAAGGGWPLGAAMMAVTIVQGLANVANIRKADAGFDDPVNDAIAVSFGRKFANDVVRLISVGFNQTMLQQARQGSGHTIDRSMTINGGVHLGGFFGVNETQLLKQLNRKLITVQRLERRATV